MKVLPELKYTKTHEWVKLDGDVATVGITDFAQKQLGDMAFIDVDSEGETLDAGEVFGTVEAVKAVSDVFLPIAGEILELNEELGDAPELVNSDPYGKGWLVKVKVSDVSDLDNLLDVDAYKSLIENEAH